MGLVQVVPEQDSYVVEWVGLKFNASEGLVNMRRILDKSPWVIQLVIDEGDPYAVITQVRQASLEQWKVHHGDWVVRSPHDKVWVMSDVEFHSQFDVPYSEEASHG